MKKTHRKLRDSLEKTVRVPLRQACRNRYVSAIQEAKNGSWKNFAADMNVNH